jgi:hypothetical protein
MTFSLKYLIEVFKEKEYTDYDSKMFSYQLSHIYNGYVNWLIQEKNLSPPNAMAETLNVHANAMANMISAFSKHVDRSDKKAFKEDVEMVFNSIKRKILADV